MTTPRVGTRTPIRMAVVVYRRPSVDEARPGTLPSGRLLERGTAMRSALLGRAIQLVAAVFVAGHLLPDAGPAWAQPTKFKEAPMLADRVKAGTLPPVDKRLPQNPLVVPVVERAGQYGGVW